MSDLSDIVYEAGGISLRKLSLSTQGIHGLKFQPLNSRLIYVNHRGIIKYLKLKSYCRVLHFT